MSGASCRPASRRIDVQALSASRVSHNEGLIDHIEIHTHGRARLRVAPIDSISVSSVHGILTGVVSSKVVVVLLELARSEGSSAIGVRPRIAPGSAHVVYINAVGAAN